MVSALALVIFRLLELSGILILFLHEHLVGYTRQSSHKGAIHASKQALINNSTPKQSNLENNCVTEFYTLIRNYRNQNHLIRS